MALKADLCLFNNIDIVNLSSLFNLSQPPIALLWILTKYAKVHKYVQSDVKINNVKNEILNKYVYLHLKRRTNIPTVCQIQTHPSFFVQ